MLFLKNSKNSLKKTGYDYIPSYIFKTGSKYKQLTEAYQDIFKKYIQKEKELSEKERELLFIGIKHVATYIKNGFFYSVKQNYDSKTNQDKVITAIYFRMIKITEGELNFRNKYDTTIFDLAETSIFLSLGMETYKKRDSFKWNIDSGFYKNFLKHSSEVVFKSLIYDYMKELSEIANEAKQDINKESIEAVDITELSTENILNKSGIEWAIPTEIKDKIKEYLNYGELKHLKEITPYLEKIYAELKKKKEIL